MTLGFLAKRELHNMSTPKPLYITSNFSETLSYIAIVQLIFGFFALNEFKGFHYLK